MEYTTVVGVTAGRPLGEQFAALLMSCCVGEAVRDAGGHALVVLNDISPMVRETFVNVWMALMLLS